MHLDSPDPPPQTRRAPHSPQNPLGLQSQRKRSEQGGEAPLNKSWLLCNPEKKTHPIPLGLCTAELTLPQASSLRTGFQGSAPPPTHSTPGEQGRNSGFTGLAPGLLGSRQCLGGWVGGVEVSSQRLDCCLLPHPGSCPRVSRDKRRTIRGRGISSARGRGKRTGEAKRSPWCLLHGRKEM